MPHVIVDLRNVPLPAHVREMSEDEDDGFYEMMVAEREARHRGLENMPRCLACPHLPQDEVEPDLDDFSLTLIEMRRHRRVACHAQGDCGDCPYLPENYGKPVRFRVMGVDDWGDNVAADQIRLARFHEWEARHAAD